MSYAIIAAVVALLAGGAVYTIKRNKAIQQNGIEVDAVVSRIDENVDTDNDGNRNISYNYFVQYRDRNGNTVEAKLGSAPPDIYRGMSIRVKYLPEKPKFVIPAR